MSKLKFGIGALQAFQENYQELLDRLIKGYRKMTNKEPEGLDLIKIKQEARRRAEDASKVVDMEGKTLDPSKPIMGGKQEGMFDDVFDKMYEESKGGIPMTIKGKTKTMSVDEIMDFVQGKKGKESIMKADDAPKPEKTKTKEMFEEFEERTNIKPGKIDYDKMEDKLGVELFGDETFDELLEIERTGKHPRMKADGGRINFALGGPTNIIGAGLADPNLLGAGMPMEEEDEFADIRGQTAGLGVLSFLNKALGPKIGTYVFDRARDKVISKGIDIAQEAARKKRQEELIREQAMKSAEVVAAMAAANRASGTGGYQSDFAQDSGFMGGSGTAAEMGSFAYGGLASMFTEKR